MRLENKVALITGGARGIGAAITKLFSQEGSKLVIGDVLKEEGRKIAEEIAAVGGNCFFVKLDVTNEADWKMVTEEVVDHYGKLDVLVNNAGVSARGNVEDTTEAQWSRTMDINVKGTFLAINEVVPIMRKQGGGKILNLSSVTGVMGFKTFSIYCSSIAAVNYLSRSLSLELSPDNIAVNAILPGNTATPMNVKIRTEPQFKGMLEDLSLIHI